MTIQHEFKILAFGLLGFSFGPYVPLLAGLLAFGFAGTWVGGSCSTVFPSGFRVGLKAMSLIALRLLYGAAGAFVG